MTEADEDGAAGARARRLREEIARLRRPAGPGEERPIPGPVSPREFTDAAAERQAREANVQATVPETEAGGQPGPTDRED